MISLTSSVAITEFLASCICLCFFTQIAVDLVIDRVEPKWVLFCIGIGQCSLFSSHLNLLILPYSLLC